MDALIREFAAGLADTARGDIEAAIDRALKKAGTGRANRALANLREKALASLDRIADGRDGRMPAAVLDEVHAGIHAALHPEAERGLALAKRASGPVRRGADVTEAQSGGDDLTAALSALGKEFRVLADRGRKICDTPSTVIPFGGWEQRHRRDLLEALLQRDLEATKAI